MTTNCENIEKLIAKFSTDHSHAQFSSNLADTAVEQNASNYLDLRQRLANQYYTNNSNYFVRPLISNSLPVQRNSNNLSNSTSSCINERFENEKLKFFNILKSLFAIFDPECQGCIDINELDKFSGKNNEILKDVINYIRTTQILSNNKPLLNFTNKKLKNAINSLISFDEFVKAAEIVLHQRKQIKMNVTNVENTSQASTSRSCTLFSSSTNNSVPSSTATLSQAFENAEDNSTASIMPKSQTIDSLNINAYDLKNLIDKENTLLTQGLENVDAIKRFYLSQLVENRLKLTNISKLKHQNLFSIDRMLLELNKLNDFNKYLANYLKANVSSTTLSNKIDSSTSPIVKFDIDNENLNLFQSSVSGNYGHFEASNEDLNSECSSERDANNSSSLEFDMLLKKKKEKIEKLQKEKSQLIRKLYEMKSEAENISKNLIKLQTNKSHEQILSQFA